MVRTLIFSLSSGFRGKIISTVLKVFCLSWAVSVRRDASERDSSEALRIKSLHAVISTVSIKHGLRTADCGRGPGIKHGLGIKCGLNIKCGLSLKIAVLTNKHQKMLLFSVFSSAFELSKTKSCFPGRLSFLSRSEWHANKRKHCKFRVRTQFQLCNKNR